MLEFEGARFLDIFCEAQLLPCLKRERWRYPGLYSNTGAHVVLTASASIMNVIRIAFPRSIGGTPSQILLSELSSSRP